MNTKIQLNFSSKVNAQNQVLERSTLCNIATNSITEAAELYEQLKAALGGEVVTSQHKELPQLATRSAPARLPSPTTYEPELGRCPHCSTPLRQFVSRKNSKTYAACPKYRTTGCSFIKELES
jgi:uncharacterized protein with PIN domain